MAEAVDARSAFLSVDLLVILIALGGYLYFVESKQPAGGDAEKKEKAFTVEADKIEEFTIKSESGERTTLRKSGTRLADRAAGQHGKPDCGEVSGITSNLSSLEVQRVIDENPSDLTEYSLTQPRVEVAFKAGGKDHKLLIGRKTPPGSDLYARIDDQKRVVLIPSFVDTTFNKTTFDLRDKAVLTVNRDEIGIAGRHDAGEHDAASRSPAASGSWPSRSRRARISAPSKALVSRLDHAADEVDCRARGGRRRAVRPRQTGRDGGASAPDRHRPRSRSASRRERARSTRATCRSQSS